MNTALTAAVERGEVYPTPLGLLPEEIAELTRMPRLATWAELSREVLSSALPFLVRFQSVTFVKQSPHGRSRGPAAA